MILRNFAVFEGIDGTGTTTQLGLLKEQYGKSSPSGGAPVYFTAEPTASCVGKLIRAVLRGEVSLEAETVARLFAADRNEHLYGTDGILSQLRQGKAVFSDRYVFSSFAYQGETVKADLVRAQNEDFPLPEFLFFFDIDPETAMKRVEKRNGTREIYETTEFQKKVRDRFLAIIAEFEATEPEMRVVRLDATEGIDVIAEKIWSIAKDLPKIKG